MSSLALTTGLALAMNAAMATHHSACMGDVAEVCDLLERQETAWNAGDIHGFMAGYWRSEALRFASGGTVTTGWEATLQRYLERYDSQAAMGELDFTGVDVQQLSGDSAIAFGRWQLFRETDAPAGLFTLIFRRIEGEWVIVHDHTSSAD